MCVCVCERERERVFLSLSERQKRMAYAFRKVTKPGRSLTLSCARYVEASVFEISNCPFGFAF